MFDKIHFSRGIQDLLVTLFSRGGIMLIGLAMQSVLAWTLGPEGRGEFAVCFVFSSISAIILILGVDWATCYFISTKRFPNNQIISYSIVYYIISVCVALLVLPAIINLNLEFFRKAPSGAFQIAVYWALSISAFSLSSQILAGMREFNSLALLVVIKALSSLIGTFLLFKTTDLHVTAPILADTASGFGVAMVVLLLITRKHGYRWEWPQFSLIHNISSYSLRFSGGSFGMIANAHIGLIFVSFYVGSKELGYFSLAIALLAQLITVADVTARAIQPRIASSHTGRTELVSLCVRMVSTLVFLAGLVLIGTSELWIPILFSPSFLPIITILVILMPGIWIRAIGKTLFAYFNGVDRPGVVTVTTIINLLANFLLLSVLVKPFGLKGAAFASTISYAVSTMYVSYKYLQVSSGSIQDFLVPRRRDMEVLINQFVRQPKTPIN